MRLDSIVPIWRSGVVKLLLCRRGHSYAFGLPPPFIGPFSIFSTTQAEQRHTAMQLSSIEDAERLICTVSVTLFIWFYLAPMSSLHQSVTDVDCLFICGWLTPSFWSGTTRLCRLTLQEEAFSSLPPQITDARSPRFCLFHRVSLSSSRPAWRTVTPPLGL